MSPETPIWYIVDCCRVWESHADTKAWRFGKPVPERVLPTYTVDEPGRGTADQMVAAVTVTVGNFAQTISDAVGVDDGTCVVGRPASAVRSVVDGYADFAGEVAVCVVSPAVLAGAVAVEASSPAVAGVASLADLAGGVTVVVTPSAVAGVASPADLAGLSPSVWHPWPMVASLAVAGWASLAGLAVLLAG